MHRLLCLLTLLVLVRPAASRDGPRVTPPDGPLKPLDTQTRADALKDIEEATRHFDAMTSDYDLEMKSIVLREVAHRKASLEKTYAKRIEDIDVIQKQRRLEAIAALRRFVERYPDHPEHTPDAMFRLAELYFEKAQVDQEFLQAQYEKDNDLFQRGKLPTEPVPPKTDFAESVKLYDEVIRRFQTYRYRDIAYYMKGYCQYQSGLEREARDAWITLATKYPESKYAPEAWLRIGEYHFDYGEWKEAETSYLAAAKYPEGKFYDMALYKLAWTYFQMYDYDRAIKGFKGLIAHYDSLKGKLGSGLGSALRDEAIQYLAKSLAEDDWDGDGEPDPGAGVDRALAYLNEGLPFEREILEEYAKTLYDIHEIVKYKQAAVVYRRLIDRDPNNPKNPTLHERLIEVYDLAGDLKASADARDELYKRYGKESAWYKANLANAKATNAADRLVEAAVRQKALAHHALAQELKTKAKLESDPKRLAESRAEYDQAAAAYREYLKAYPTGKETYAMMFLLAEALYYAEHYFEAAGQYASVRDFPGKTEHKEEAAFSAIKSVEQHLENLVASNKLPKKALATNAEEMPEEEQSKKGVKITRVKPEKVPEVMGAWVAHSDKYVELKLEHKEEKNFPATQSYRIALMYFNFLNYDEARRRFEVIFKAWPTTREAAYSVLNTINTYKVENDWANFEKWAKIAEDAEIGTIAEREARRKAIAIVKLGVQFEKAEALFTEKRYVEAAKEFERVIAEDPKSKFADKALRNAGIAYQNSKHWNSAARVFEQIATEPRFKGSEYREEALFNLAENHRRFFDFEKAVDRYLALMKQYPGSKNAAYSLFKAAQIQEITGKLAEAADTYQRYAREFPDRDDTSAALYRAGICYEQLKDVPAQQRLWKDYISRFERTPGADAKVIEATLKLADLYNEQGTADTARKFYEKTISEFTARGMQPQSDAAAFAAKAQFELIETSFRRYSEMRLSGNLASMGRTIKAKQALLKEVEAGYQKVFPYKAFDWTIAAFLRVGQLYQLYADMLYKAPDPTGLTDEQMDDYKTSIEDEGVRWENIAIERYEETVKQSRKLKVVNKWSQLALVGANKYKPTEYPLFKEEKRAYDFDHGYAVPSTPPPPDVKKPEAEFKQEEQKDPEAPKTPEPSPEPEPPAPTPEPEPPAPVEGGGAP